MSFLSSNCNNPNNLPGYELNTYTKFPYPYPISTRFPPLIKGGNRKTKKHENKKKYSLRNKYNLRKKQNSKKTKKRISSKKYKKRKQSKKFKTKKNKKRKLQKGGIADFYPVSSLMNTYDTLMGNPTDQWPDVTYDQMTHYE
jgi:hypothetical protein